MSSQSRSFITSLTPDIIDNVTQRLTCQVLGRLLLLGDRSFSSLLLRKGSVTILDHSRFMGHGSWYPLLNSFEHITSLTFGRIGATLLGLESLKLPNTLTRLELIGQLISFDVRLLDLGLLVPHLTYLNLDVSLDHSFSDWILKLPKTLTFLEVSHFTSPCLLPEGLGTFHVSSLIGGAGEVVLPSTIHTLRLSFTNLENLKSLIPGLPPQLHDLYLRSSEKSTLESDFTWPPSLKILEMHRLDASHIQFPASLNELTFSSRIESLHFIQALPRDLTKLIISNMAYGQISASDFFAALPRCMLHLSLECLGIYYGNSSDRDHWDIGPNIIFPPNLRYLKTHYTSVFAEAIHLIPPSITELAIGLVHDSVDHFPAWPALRRLTIGKIRLTPSHLRHLAHGSPYISRISIHNDTEPIIDIDISNERNPWETDEEISANGSFSFRFGPCLTEVEITNCIHIGDSLIPTLPVSLVKLKTPNATGFTDCGIQALQSYTNLELLHISRATFTGSAFKYLPRSLTALFSSRAKEVFDHQIQDLPRNLQTLYLNGAVELTDACASSLPKKLTTLSIDDNMKMTPDIFPLLPLGLLANGFSQTFSTGNFTIRDGKTWKRPDQR